MNRKVTAIFAAVILSFTAVQLYAVPIDKIFTSSGQILDGEEWSNVYIYNDDTIVDMLGGDVDGIGTYDASTVNVTGGHVNTFDALEFSTANISGGYVYSLRAGDSATASIFDGGFVSSLTATGNLGTVSVYGGIVDYVCPGESGLVNLYGGLITDSLSALDQSVVNVFGYDLIKTNYGGIYGHGQVYGFWSDGTSFTIDLNGLETYSHINLIPEPSSLILLFTGVLILRRIR